MASAPPTTTPTNSNSPPAVFCGPGYPGPPDRTAYGAALWSHILRDQLQTGPDEFWQCVQLGAPPGRGAPLAPAGAIPTDLLYLLKNRVGLTDDQIAEMSRQTAIERAQQYWTTGH